MGLTRAEQETVIRWDEDEKVVYVYSASPVTWRRMARLGFASHKETTSGGAVSGRFYRLPHGEFRWGRKRRVSYTGPRPRFGERHGKSRAPQPQNGDGA